MYTAYANNDYGYSHETSSYGLGGYNGESFSQSYSYYGPSGGGSYSYSTYDAFYNGYLTFRY